MVGVVGWNVLVLGVLGIVVGEGVVVELVDVKVTGVVLLGVLGKVNGLAVVDWLVLVG